MLTRGDVNRLIDQVSSSWTCDIPANHLQLHQATVRLAMLELKILLSQLTDVPLPPPVEVVRPQEFKPESIEEVERRHILATLEHFDWVKTKSAKSLGIERSTLDRKLQQYGVHRP